MGCPACLCQAVGSGACDGGICKDPDKLKAESAELAQLTAQKADISELTAATAHIDQLDADKLSVKGRGSEICEHRLLNIDQASIGHLYATSASSGSDDRRSHDHRRAGGRDHQGRPDRGAAPWWRTSWWCREDGLYYKLNTDGVSITAEQTEYNSLNGSVITAKSVTAEKISVSDLVAFGADIGGFHITTDAIYSGVKASADNTARGVYLDSGGQLCVGDGTSFLALSDGGGRQL